MAGLGVYCGLLGGVGQDCSVVSVGFLVMPRGIFCDDIEGNR